MKQCPSCNTPNEDAAMFCEKCGASLPKAEPVVQSADSAGAAPSAAAWAQKVKAQQAVDGFHRGYANALKIVAYIGIIIMALAVLITCTVTGGALGFFLGIIGAVIVGFLFWFLTMYNVKMFDLTSKIAMTNSYILEELRKEKK